MANINSLTGGSSTSNLYGTRNVISGLATGIDTESMIENSVSGYKTKITSLQQQQEKLQWKQDAYREVTDSLASLNDKYTSYTSKTNLYSNAFFNQSVTSTSGKYADAVSATGKATSDIQLNAVKSLATAARRSVGVDGSSALKKAMTTAGDALNWNSSVAVSNIAGSNMSIKIGSNTARISFNESDKYSTLQELADGINGKLAEVDATSKKAGRVKASDLVKATVDGDEIKLEYTGRDGDAAYISGVSGKLSTDFGIESGTLADGKGRSFTLDTAATPLTGVQDMTQYLAGKKVSVTLDGVTREIEIGALAGPDLSAYDAQMADLESRLETADESEMADLNAQLDAVRDERTDALNTQMSEQLAANLQQGIDRAFGANRATVASENGALKFGVADGSGSSISVTSSVGTELGIGKSGVSNYVNTSRTLGSLLSPDFIASNALRAQGSVETGADGKSYDSDGSLVKQFGEGADAAWYRVDSDGNRMFDMTINGTNVGTFTEKSSLDTVLSRINNNNELGVNASYSRLTNEFTFTATQTGSTGKVDFGSGLATELFGKSTAGDKTVGELFGIEGGQEVSFKFGSSGMSIRNVTSDTTLSELVNQINSQAGSTRLAYNADTDEFSLARSSKYDTLDDIKISVDGNRTTLGDLLKPTFTAGTDAVVSATVNGRTLELTRSSNTIDMDGMSVTLKDTFNEDYDAATMGRLPANESVTFTTKADADAIMDGIRSFVNDYNTLAKQVHDAYSTMPAEKNSSTHTKYEPLTEDDKNSMSESAVKAYEEKAKQGLLFGDTDLSALYNRMTSALSSLTTNKAASDAGLTVSYSNGVAQISLNEDKLRDALDSNPDSVKNVFTSSTANGSSRNGLISTLKNTLDAYGSTSIVTPGILVSKAGTKLSAPSLLSNTVQKQIDNLQTQIQSWQTKMSSKIDYYTRQFTALEQLTNTLNSQSSALASLMGY